MTDRWPRWVSALLGCLFILLGVNQTTYPVDDKRPDEHLKREYEVHRWDRPIVALLHEDAVAFDVPRHSHRRERRTQSVDSIAQDVAETEIRMAGKPKQRR